MRMQENKNECNKNNDSSVATTQINVHHRMSDYPWRKQVHRALDTIFGVG